MGQDLLFMGIIDILQQYNARKRIETRYRKLEVKGGLEPSCVSPEEYAARFISFFDEYSTRTPKKPKASTTPTEDENETTQVEVSLRNCCGGNANDVQIDVSTTPPVSSEYKRPARTRKKAPPTGRVVVTVVTYSGVISNNNYCTTGIS